MTDELKARLRAELDAERPPPIGDLVGAALRDGRRRRRNRRIGMSAALAGAVAVTLVLIADFSAAAQLGRLPAAAPAHELLPPDVSLSPGSVPIERAAPTGTAPARTLTIHSGTGRAEGTQQKATSAAMLHLLTQLLPPGRTSRYGVASGDDLRVQVYLDDGDGPRRVGVAVGGPADRTRRDGSVIVTVTPGPGDCAGPAAVDAVWTDGTTVRLDVAGCGVTTDEAIAIAADPRWGVTMDAALVGDGAARFPRLPEFAS